MTRHHRARRTHIARAGAARMTLLSWTGVATLALAYGASALGAPAATPAAPAGCPATAPTAAGTPSGDGQVLSGSVVAMRLCRYGTLPARKLQGQHLTRSHAVISGLYKQLDALLPVPQGPTSCPEDNGSEILLVARYRSGQATKVTVALTGCRTVTRGRVAKSAEISPGGAALLAELQRLTP